MAVTKKIAERELVTGSKVIPCPECVDELPSLNWKNGKRVWYCPECGREEREGKA